MAFRSRKPAVTSIDARWREAFQEQRIRLEAFTPIELDLVQVWGQGGLVRFPRDVPRVVGTDSELQQARKRLETAGYLRPGEPRYDGPAEDQVPATVGPDREAVTLLGDYAIACALRGSPATVVEARFYDSLTHLAEEDRIYTGVEPEVVLQEVTLDDGRLGFFLYRADRGLLALARSCGIVPEDLEQELPPPAHPAIPGVEARQRWGKWTELRVARPEGTDVTLTTLAIGQAPDGLWLLEPPYDMGTAIWTVPNDVGERLSQLLVPGPGASSWLPRDPGRGPSS